MNTASILKLALVTVALVGLGLFLTNGFSFFSGDWSTYELTGISFGDGKSQTPPSAAQSPQTPTYSLQGDSTVEIVYEDDSPADLVQGVSEGPEPDYQSKPFYCRLAFGSNREFLMLTAADLKARVLYADLNLNGDLTEAGESFDINQTSQYKQTIYLTATVPEVSVGESTHTNLKIKFGKTGDRVKGVFAIQLWGWSESTTDADLVPLEMSNNSSTIPLLHFDGPLTMGNYRKVVEMPRGEESKFYSLIGTPGESGGTLTAIDNTEIAEDANPKVEFEFPHEDPSKPAIKVKAYLPTRC